MTPAEWAALNAAMTMYEETPEDEAPFCKHEARQRVIRLAGPHMRELIDAARPKCEACDGEGRLLEPSRSDPWGFDVRSCSDCDGTGWAK